MFDKDKGKVDGGAHSGASKRVLRQPSIKDIARLARVSHPTVSRALQNSPLVNAKTAEKIRKNAKESGYRASAVARGLVTRRTRTIGLVVTTVADPFTSEVVTGIEQTANDHGYCVFLADSNADPDRERKIVQSFAEQRVDGIIVTSSRVGALYLPLFRRNDGADHSGERSASWGVCPLSHDLQPGRKPDGGRTHGQFRSSADRLYWRPIRLSIRRRTIAGYRRHWMRPESCFFLSSWFAATANRKPACAQWMSSGAR